MQTETPHSSVPSAELSLNAIFHTLVDAIIVINSRGMIVECNQATLNMFGYVSGALHGLNVSTLMPEPDHSRHDQYIRNYEETGERKIIGIGREVVGKRKDGSLFPLRLAVSHFMEHGQHFYVGIIHDLTEEIQSRELKENYHIRLHEEVETRTEELKNSLELRRKAEELLLQSQKVYTTIARNYPNGTITILDADFNYVFVEGKGLSDLGIDPRFLIGTNYMKRLRPELRDLTEKHLQEVLRGIARSFEIEFSDHCFLIDAVPIKEKSTVNSILMIETNITHLKQAEQDMLKALHKEKELGELKTRFVSMASHEFRTPLSTINSSADLISRYNDQGNTTKIQDHVHKIRKNIAHLNQILNDFLSLGKLEEGLIRNKPVPSNVSGLLDELVEDAQLNLKTGQQLQRSYPVNLNALLDPDLFRNVLINLLSNAIKYSDAEKGIIVLEAAIEPKGLRLWVRDNGMGIPQDDQKNLFSRFFRARNVTNIDGTGLGLHIVRQYLELMGGLISYHSMPNEGTTFEVFIPLNTDEEENSSH
jgi:PAS domain S-box-containing protein